jgi:Ca2+-binding EF-hand superfamily protein
MLGLLQATLPGLLLLLLLLLPHPASASAAAAAAAAEAPPDGVLLGRLFQRLDADADGELSAAELGTGLHAEHARARSLGRKRKHAAAHREFERALQRCGAPCCEAAAAAAGGDAGLPGLSPSAVRVHLPDMHAVRGPTEAERARRFRLADVAPADGVLGSAEELLLLLHPAHALPHETHTSAALARHVAAVDADGDGRVGFEEHYAEQARHARLGEGAAVGGDEGGAGAAAAGGVAGNGDAGAGGVAAAGRPQLAAAVRRGNGVHLEHRLLARELRARELERFRRHDLDRDGSLDRAELRRLLFPVHEPADVVRLEVRHLLSVADADRNGRLSLREAREQARRLVRFLHERAERIDAAAAPDEL